MVITHAAATFGQHFHPRILKKMDLGTVCQFGITNHGKVLKMSSKWVPGASQNAPKMV